MIVVDVSVAAKWFIPDEHTKFSNAVLEKIVREYALEPALFRWEIQNVLTVAQRADRLTGDDVDEALETLRDLPIFLEPAGERVFSGSELQFARHYRLTAYDAAYLTVAIHHRIALATMDVQLCHAGRDLGIEILTSP